MLAAGRRLMLSPCVLPFDSAGFCFFSPGGCPGLSQFSLIEYLTCKKPGVQLHVWVQAAPWQFRGRNLNGIYLTPSAYVGVNGASTVQRLPSFGCFPGIAHTQGRPYLIGLFLPMCMGAAHNLTQRHVRSLKAEVTVGRDLGFKWGRCSTPG